MDEHTLKLAQELSDKWKARGLRAILSRIPDRREFLQDYASLYGRPCVTCPNKLPSYYEQLTQMKMENICEYEFKTNGARTLSRLGNITVSNANLTNELGARIVAEYPEHAKKWFKRMPSGTPKASKASNKGAEATFEDQLNAIKGIGKKIAARVAKQAGSKEELLEALAGGKIDENSNVLELLNDFCAA